MDAIREGWFSELSELWPGQCMSLEIEEVLLHEKSKFQDIMVVKRYGFVVNRIGRQIGNSGRHISMPMAMGMAWA